MGKVLMMETSYAIPGAVHGNGHVRGHSRKSVSEKLPLEPTSSNSGPHLNGYQYTREAKHHAHSQSLHVQPQKDPEKPRVDHSRSRSHLPPPSLPPMDTPSVRPKGRRFSSGLPTHLKIEPTNYGFRSSSKPAYATSSEGVKRRHWFTVPELASAILVSLPYSLLSIANSLHTGSSSLKSALESGSLGTEAQEEVMPTTSIPLVAIGPNLLSTCAVTAGTLLLVGGTARIRGLFSGSSEPKPGAIGHRRTGSTQAEIMTIGGIRKILARSFSIGLPFYATLKLGGVETGLVLLTALVTDLMGSGDKLNLASTGGLKRLLKSRRWTMAAISLQAIYNLAIPNSGTGLADKFSGLVALSVCVLILPPPFPAHSSKKDHITSPAEPPPSSGTSILTIFKEIPTTSSAILPDPKVSSLTLSPNDIDLTLAAGTLTGLLTIVSYVFSSIPSASAISMNLLGGGIFTIITAALSLTMAQPQSLRESRGIGLLIGSLTSCSLLQFLGPTPWIISAFQAALIFLFSAATIKDTHSSRSSTHHTHGHGHGHSHHEHPEKHLDHHDEPSRFSKYVLGSSQKWPLLHSILVEKDSRRIFYFMILNFAFMLVQTFYGIATGSLGLLSDSIHMFFDCLALIVGLSAAVMSKWPPSTRFPYGFGKVDTLAGFANGIFLMLISIEIVYEAIERLAEGSEMHRLGELLTVSGLGLMVNLVGMTAFGHAHHGHGHSHGGDDHNHDHEHTPAPLEHSGHSHDDDGQHDHHHHDNHVHTHLHDHLHACPSPSPHGSIPATPSKPVHAHSHAHGHHYHHHGNENMHGIFLHILADTMGSVAVIISTLLIHFYGWSGFDPIASVIIAVLIFASAIPLVKSSARTLLLTIPEDTEFDLREALAGVSALRGVVGYAVPKFWLDEREERRVLGVIHVFVAKNADMEDVKERAVAFLKTRGMNVLVQVEREGSGRCWCRGGLRAG